MFKYRLALFLVVGHLGASCNNSGQVSGGKNLVKQDPTEQELDAETPPAPKVTPRGVDIPFSTGEQDPGTVTTRTEDLLNSSPAVVNDLEVDGIVGDARKYDVSTFSPSGVLNLEGASIAPVLIYTYEDTSIGRIVQTTTPGPTTALSFSLYPDSQKIVNFFSNNNFGAVAFALCSREAPDRTYYPRLEPAGGQNDLNCQNQQILYGAESLPEGICKAELYWYSGSEQKPLLLPDNQTQFTGLTKVSSPVYGITRCP